MIALPAPAAHAAPATGSGTPVMVILDASGSMNTADAPGSRIDAAKRAVDNLVGSLPASSQVGLEVYGTHTSSATSEKTAGCKDITVLNPVGTLNAAAIKAKVAGITARGYTPIGNALRKAAQQLPKTGPRSIVLVSDGIDTCAPPNPCTVAKQLKAQGVDLTVDTIGFRVDSTARTQLSCIAAATGGSYYDAGDAASLNTQLNRGVVRAIKPYAVVGQPINGTPTPAGAPEMQPGQYVDSLPGEPAGSIDADGPAKYYRITVRKGWTPYISVTLIPPPEGPNTGSLLAGTITVSGVNASSSCNFGNDYDGDSVGWGELPPFSIVDNLGVAGGPDWPDGCPSDGQLLVKVTRSGDVAPGALLRAELSYRLEPPADVTGQPPAATDQPPVSVAAPTASTKVTPVVSGSSYNDAPVLAPGTYSDTIVSGETRFVGVKLGWGQRLAYRIDASATPGVGYDGDESVHTWVSNPLRQQVPLSSVVDGQVSSVQFSNSTFGQGPHIDPMTGTTAVPVRYQNRTSDQSDVSSSSVAGTYYVWINTGPPGWGESKQPYETKYTLTLQVIGKAQPGPKYDTGTSAAASSTSAPPTAAPSSAAATPATSATPGSASTPPAAAGSAHGASSDGSTPVPLIAGSAAAVVLAGIVVGFALRRRSQRASQM